jgi:hypothetical protein
VEWPSATIRSEIRELHELRSRIEDRPVRIRVCLEFEGSIPLAMRVPRLLSLLHGEDEAAQFSFYCNGHSDRELVLATELKTVN